MAKSANGVSCLRVVRTIAAPAERVFDAWLDPASIRAWMCAGDIVESIASIDARVGGEFSIVMRSPGGDDPHRGRYLEMDRPRRLVFTWASAATNEEETLVTIDIRATGPEACELTLVHSDLPQQRVAQHGIGWRAHLRLLIDFSEAE